MSANNWALCPKCESIRKINQPERKLELNRKYGKISSEEYLRLIEDGKMEEEGELEETLREDYELGISKRWFHVGYYACCKVCGFTYEFKVDKPVYPEVK